MLNFFQSMFDMISNLFSLQTAKSNNKTVDNIISDKNELEKAALYTEKIINLIYKKAIFKTRFSKLRFESLVKKFRKYR